MTIEWHQASQDLESISTLIFVTTFRPSSFFFLSPLHIPKLSNTKPTNPNLPTKLYIPHLTTITMKFALIFSTATLATLVVATPLPTYASSLVPSSVPYPSSHPTGLGLMDDNAVPSNRLPPGGIANTDAHRSSIAHRTHLKIQIKKSNTYYDAEGEKEQEVERLALALNAADVADDNGAGSE